MSTIRIVRYKCPICKEKFNYVIQFSYTTFGVNLDFKPFGAAIIPRLREFENAIELIETLTKDNNLPDNEFRQALPYQLYLINQNDIEEHKTPPEREKKALLL
jgi:hypothetical protein